MCRDGGDPGARQGVEPESRGRMERGSAHPPGGLVYRGATSGLLLLAILLGPTGAAGQSIEGIVTEAGTDRPVAGAMVRLHTEGGPAGPLHLTAADGLYRLRVPGAGLYWLQVERVGFADVRAGPVRVDGGETPSFDVELAPEPVRLEGLDPDWIDADLCHNGQKDWSQEDDGTECLHESPHNYQKYTDNG